MFRLPFAPSNSNPIVQSFKPSMGVLAPVEVKLSGRLTI